MEEESKSDKIERILHIYNKLINGDIRGALNLLPLTCCSLLSDGAVSPLWHSVSPLLRRLDLYILP